MRRCLVVDEVSPLCPDRGLRVENRSARGGRLVRVLIGALLAAAWIVVGIAALLPTTVAAVALAFARPHNSKRIPFGWFLVAPLTLGGLLALAHVLELLPFLRDWLLSLAEMRPVKTVLATDLLSGEKEAVGPYLMMLVGEIATAACILLLAARPGMWARSIQYVCDDFASTPKSKSGRLGLAFLFLAALICWYLPNASLEARRIGYYSLVFFPVAPLATCVFAAVGWRMLFADRPDPAPETSKD